jgi:chemotaxis protein methyltransferase CheR
VNEPGSSSQAVLQSGSALQRREFEYGQADFERVRKLIHQHAGISLAPIKQDMVYSRLARRLRALKISSFAAYLDHLERVGGGEWETFVNALTTNLTSFFREAHHFEILKQHVKKVHGQSRRVIKLWCSASSTGEEAYSLAIALCELFDSLTPPIEILASDLDTEVLGTGATGVYPQDRVEKLDPERLRRFFVKATGIADGSVRVRPELQKLISFSRINLLHDNWPVRGPLDAIFCRNVMIYFDKATQYSVLKKFVPLLRADGLLFAGHSESFLHAADLFRSLGRTVYERADRDR